MLLERETYADFCSEVRKVNIQSMCGYCNNFKATRIIDLRDDEVHEKLLDYLEKYGILESIEFEDADEFIKEVYRGK